MKKLFLGLLISLGLIGPALAVLYGNNVTVTFTPTVQNAAYSSGNSLGGLQTINFFTTPTAPGGKVDNFYIISKGGSTVAMTVYIFDTNPTGSTCTDKVAFSLAVADVAKLAVQPFTITPAVVGTGTTASSGASALSYSVHNGDSPMTSKLYVCVTTAGVTPATTTDLVFNITGASD